MWSHRSFFPVFKETLEKAILVKSNFNHSVFTANLADVASNPEYEKIKGYLSDYIMWNRPDTDNLNSIMPPTDISFNAGQPLTFNRKP